jgi:hypothetical protein
VAAWNSRTKLPNTRDRPEDVSSKLRPIFSDSLHLAACHTFVFKHNATGTGRFAVGAVNSSVITGNYFRQLSSISIHVVSIGAELSGIKAGSRMPAAPVKRPASWAFALKTRQILACSLTRSLTPARDLSDVREISSRTRYYLFDLARSGSHEYRAHYVRRCRTDGARKAKIGRERTWYRWFARWHTSNPKRRVIPEKARCTRWRSTETLASSLVTGTLAVPFAVWNRRKKEKETERERERERERGDREGDRAREREEQGTILSLNRMRHEHARSPFRSFTFALFMIFSCISPFPFPRSPVLRRTRGERVRGVSEWFHAEVRLRRASVTTAIERVVSRREKNATLLMAATESMVNAALNN